MTRRAGRATNREVSIPEAGPHTAGRRRDRDDPAGTATAAPVALSLDGEIIEQLFVTSTLLKKRGDRDVFGRRRLTTSLFAILTKIATGRDSPSKLREYVEGTPASIAQKLAQLEALGLITRRLDGEDRRRSILRLSKKGEAVFSELRSCYQSRVAALFAGFDQRSKEQLLSMLRTLGRRLRSP